jgi:hypothetical protein
MYAFVLTTIYVLSLPSPSVRKAQKENNKQAQAESRRRRRKRNKQRIRDLEGEKHSPGLKKLRQFVKSLRTEESKEDRKVVVLHKSTTTVYCSTVLLYNHLLTHTLSIF